MVILRALCVTLVLFLACWTTLPTPALAGGHNHGRGNHGLDTLLTAGVLASVLQNRGGGGGGGGKQQARSEIPIGGQYEGRSAMPYMPYPQPMGYGLPQPMMAYGPQPMMPFPQQPVQYAQQPVQYAQQPVMSSYVPQGSSQVSVNNFPGFQPTDKVEIIRL